MPHAILGQTPAKTLKGPKGDSKVVIYWDRETSKHRIKPGFGLRIMADRKLKSGTTKPGKRVWILNTATQTGVQRRFNLGAIGTTTYERAREKAQQYLDQIADGEDPMRDQRELRQSGSIAELVV